VRAGNLGRANGLSPKWEERKPEVFSDCTSKLSSCQTVSRRFFGLGKLLNGKLVLANS
jgi:hypothetical protein